ncbi:MAG: MltA domain-containing protein [Brevundimonas sp.]|uniref:MltA domain-containing protein n=1 Tax=Brevundimonas sp. TaxID=1871086 RepID=UPI003919D605
MRGVLLAGSLALMAAACATGPSPAPQPQPQPAPQIPGQPAPWTPGPVDPAFAALPGWAGDDHLAALGGYAEGCGADSRAWSVCEAARLLVATPGVTRENARLFFETRFRPEGGDETGLLTAYFAPEYEARAVRDAEFSAPLLAPPPDLTRSQGPDGRSVYRQRLPNGSVRDYPDRAAIETSYDPALVMAWLKPEDLFFLQIQGSGYLTFADGSTARAAYAADNGLRFLGIARPMADEGLLPRDGTSGEAIRRWLAANRGQEADRVMRLNPRYIFFRLEPDDGKGPAGAAGVPLPERRAIAVDPAHWRYGEAVWIAANGAGLIGARDSYFGLMTALDTGSAIRGRVRADFYMGRGPLAGEEAGTVRHPLRMWRLVPRDPAS